MPRKPKKPCAHPGCPNLTEGKYCEQHKREEARKYEREGRDPATKKRYGRVWSRIRASYAKEHPFCELCLKKGILVPVEEVHHKVPLAEGGTHERSNLMSLCRSCHATIHYQRGDRLNRYKVY